MSYTIEYHRKVFMLPEGSTVPEGFGWNEHKRHRNEYFLFIKEGCNNIDPRPQEWTMPAWGWNYQLIGKVLERAAWTESGCLKMPSGDTTPEAYLKRYRREIAGAEEFSLQSLRIETGIHGAYLCLGNQHGLPAEEVSKLLADIKHWFTPYGNYLDYFRYDISFSSDEHFRAFLHYQKLTRKMGGFVALQSWQNK